MRKKKFANGKVKKQYRSKNAFTLIELLAIIVILAIIAVITVPLILNIIDDSKKGAAKDSSYGYKKGIENFYLSKFSQDQGFKFEDRAYTTEELKNLGLQIGGKEPSEGEVVFENNTIKSFSLVFDKFVCNYTINSDIVCSENSGLVINHESTTDSISVTVDFKGTATSYEYKINNGEFESSNSNTHTFSNLENNIEYEITVKVKSESGEVSKTKKISTLRLEVGEAVSFGGYNWHVIRNYTEDGQQYQTLLMDGLQLEPMAHCTDDTDPNTDCGVNETGRYLVYSWDKSLIQTYLNSTFINNLQSNGVDVNNLKNEQVCIDKPVEIETFDDVTYGGYMKEEIELVDKECSNYDEYKVRLITMSEYFNLTPYFSYTLPYEADIFYSTYIIPKLNGLKKLTNEETKLWLTRPIELYPNDVSSTMNNLSSIYNNGLYGTLGMVGSETEDLDILDVILESTSPYDIRPVITIKKTGKDFFKKSDFFSLESKSNSIIVNVDNEGIDATYEYKINDGEFESSNSNTHIFLNLDETTEYEITVRIKGAFGEKLQTKIINTKNPLGESITYGGYNWHIIREYEEDGTIYQTLLMDGEQLEYMKHCTNDADPNTDCGVDESGKYLVYSWDKSLIQTYLNNSFILDLQSKGVDTSKIKKEQVCIDPSIGGSSDYSYGGYRKEEVDAAGGTCSKYEEYTIRLITASEYYNLSYFFNDIQLPYEGVLQYGNSGKVVKLNGMQRLNKIESESWLYLNNSRDWWSMGSYSDTFTGADRDSRYVTDDGQWFGGSSYYVRDVRPVITIIK